MEIDDGVLGEERLESENVQQDRVINDIEVLEDDAYAGSFLTGERVSTNQLSSSIYLKPRMLADTEYFSLLRSLNADQRKIYLHIFHRLKISKPFHPSFQVEELEVFPTI